jgi:hypothetical protein
MVTLVNWLLTVRGIAEVIGGACAWTPSTVSGGDGHRDGEVHSALSRLHLWPVYAAHDIGWRPHRALRLRPPRPTSTVPAVVHGRIGRRPILDGLLNEYEPQPETADQTPRQRSGTPLGRGRGDSGHCLVGSGHPRLPCVVADDLNSRADAWI